MTEVPDLPIVTVVGLGPAGLDLLTVQARAAIEAVPVRFLRTTVHPSAAAVPGATSFDDLYEQADRFEEVYDAICDRLVDAARRHGEVLYAVPGSPLVLERSVRHLRSRDDVEVHLVPSLSFLDLAYDRLGIDPIEAGVRLVDGHTFATDAAGERGPLLVAHCHANWVLSEIKLAVEDATGDEEVVILQRLGGPDERVVHTTWAELDRTVDADHLTSVYVPQLGAPVGQEYVRFHQLARTLREQCPWDREQTHTTLVPYLLEECHEVIDALTGLDPDDPSTDDHLVEELGDLLYQIEFHATIAEQDGRFSMADVARGIHDKLVRRHPHVFDPNHEHATDDDALVRQWEQLKQDEKQRSSPFDGIPRSLPALARADKVLKRAGRAGLAGPPTPAGPDDIGLALLHVVARARSLGVDPELALREATDRYTHSV